MVSFFVPSAFFFFQHTEVLTIGSNLADWGGGGWSLLLLWSTVLYLIGRYDPPSPYQQEDWSLFWMRPYQCNLAALLLKRKLIISFILGPARIVPLGWGERVGRCYQKTLGRGNPTSPHLVTSPYLQTYDNFLLFSKILWLLACFNVSSSTWFSASFHIWWSQTGTPAHVIQYKK
jgi:hypothetical protein